MNAPGGGSGTQKQRTMKAIRPSIRRKSIMNKIEAIKPNLHCKKCVVVNDGFGVPVRFNKIQKKGTFLERTQLGYFRLRYGALTNHELYFFEDQK